MIDYLTYYFSTDHEPFQSLSALSDHEAIKIMEALADDTPYGERFKNPAQYFKARKETETWVREAFIQKGGRPSADYPIPMVLGYTKWIVRVAPNPDKHGEIRIPLSVFSFYDISFTYPDSMISHWLGRDQPSEYYQPELHGKVFTISEILELVAQKGLPEETWETKLPEDLAPYIEAQVWNHALLSEFKSRVASSELNKDCS